MSENRPESEFPPDHEDFEDRELESLLRNLEPSPLDVGLLAELQRDHDRIAEAEWAESSALRWKRLIPLSLAAMVVFASYVTFQYAPLFEKNASSPAIVQSAPATPPKSAPAPSVDGFVPVSAQGYLVDSSSSGVVETEEGPREKWNLEFRDAYHWHDPETNTNIRFFEPRNEEVVVPLQTD